MQLSTTSESFLEVTDRRINPDRSAAGGLTVCIDSITSELSVSDQNRWQVRNHFLQADLSGLILPSNSNSFRSADKPLIIRVPKDGRVQLTVPYRRRDRGRRATPLDCRMICSAVRERTSTHRTFTLGSTDRPGFNNPSTLKSRPRVRSKSIRTGTRCTTFT